MTGYGECREDLPFLNFKRKERLLEVVNREIKKQIIQNPKAFFVMVKYSNQLVKNSLFT